MGPTLTLRGRDPVVGADFQVEEKKNGCDEHEEYSGLKVNVECAAEQAVDRENGGCDECKCEDSVEQERGELNLRVVVEQKQKADWPAVADVTFGDAVLPIENISTLLHGLDPEEDCDEHYREREGERVDVLHWMASALGGVLDGRRRMRNSETAATTERMARRTRAFMARPDGTIS